MTARVMLLLLNLALRHTEIFELYGDKMDKHQIKFSVDILMGVLTEDIKRLGRELGEIQKCKVDPKAQISPDSEVKMINRGGEGQSREYAIQLELIELVENYDSLGLIPAIKKHWPAGAPFLDLVLDASYKKRIVEEFDYLKGNCNGR